MKLYTFDNGDGVKRVGVELSGFPGLIRDVRDFGLPYRDMTDLIRHITPLEKERISDPEAALDGRPLRLSSVRVCSPIPHPEQDIICLGINYAAHADESAQFDRKAFLLDRKKATYFSKRAYQTSGPDDLIPSYPELVTSLDYEAELAVIIGRIAKSVPLERVHEVIFGYTMANDLTARDLLEDRQWTRAKGFDGATPLGPWIETDLDTDSLNITTWVDGDVVQEGNTSEMHYSVAEQVAAASEIFTLLPGDVILTGTPAGVSVLRDGNEVEVEVEGIGSLVTRVRD